MDLRERGTNCEVWHLMRKQRHTEVNQKINQTKLGVLVVSVKRSDASALTREKEQDRENVAQMSIYYMVGRHQSETLWWPICVLVCKTPPAKAGKQGSADYQTRGM